MPVLALPVAWQLLGKLEAVAGTAVADLTCMMSRAAP